jgi:hypothetical protein
LYVLYLEAASPSVLKLADIWNQETGVFSAVNGGFLETAQLFIAQGGTDFHSRDMLEGEVKTSATRKASRSEALITPD